MEAESKVLLMEIERVLDSNPGIRVGELLSKAVKTNEDLYYIDDKDLALRIHQIGESIGVRTKEEMTNKKIYDIAHSNTIYNSEGRAVISRDDEWLAGTDSTEKGRSILDLKGEWTPQEEIDLGKPVGKEIFWEEEEE